MSLITAAQRIHSGSDINNANALGNGSSESCLKID